tara:strand:- start:1352 stop:2392 length:1041 start_codon:yes stop_codon:yes gene_type:complete
MAINVNKVYKSVLSILNKEQRGYLTPAEFNNLARQAQLELVDKLFYQYNKFLNIENVNRTNEGYADLAQKIEEQIDIHFAQSTISSNTLVIGPGGVNDLYKTIGVYRTSKNSDLNGQNILFETEVEKVEKSKAVYLNSSPLTAPSKDFPVYYQNHATIITIPADANATEVIRYIKRPANPRFGYTLNANYGIEVYDDLTFVNGGLINNKTLASTAANYTESGSYTNGTYTTFTTSGSGTGASLTLTVAGNDPTTLVVGNAGSGYKVGDTITFSGVGGSGTIVYTIKAGDTFDSSTRGSTDFELHLSQETELIISILAYAGFILKDPSIVQSAVQIGQGSEMTKQQQ